MNKEIIFMKFQNEQAGFNYQNKLKTLKEGQEMLLENVSDIFIFQENGTSTLDIPNPWKIVYKEDISIFERNKSNPWLIGKDGHLIQQGTFDGHDISYLEKTYGIGQEHMSLSKRYLARKNYY